MSAEFSACVALAIFDIAILIVVFLELIHLTL